MDGALHQAVALEATQGLCQHFLGNPPNLPLQHGVPHRPARENLDDQSSPFIGNSVQHEPRGTLRVQNGRARGRFSHASV